MNTSNIQPTGSGPIWPIAPSGASGVALPDWGVVSGSTSASQADFDLARLIRIFWEWRWLILGSVAVGVAAAIVISLLITPTYRSTAVLEINPPSFEVVDESKSGQSSAASDQAFLTTQYGLLASRSVAERVAQELNLASDEEFAPAEAGRGARLDAATNQLMGNFQVEPVPNSRLVRVSYISKSPERAAQITNTFADSFINSNLERRYEASSYARTFLERQIRKVKGELERSERQLIGYAQAQGIINISTNKEGGGGGGDTGSLQGASLMGLNEALTLAETRRISAQEAYRSALSSGMTTDVSQGTLGMRQQLAALEAEYRDKLTRMKPDYPDMVSLRNRIDELARQAQVESGTASSARLNTLRAEYQASAAAERAIQTKVDQLRGDVLNLRGRSVQYTILQREVDTNRALYDALLQRYKEIGVAGGIGKNLVSVVDRAQVPGGAYKPNVTLNLLVGLALGLIAGFAAAMVLDIINDTVKTPEDVRDKLKLASLGAIPKAEGSSSFAEELKDLTSPVSEAYFSLRAALQFATDAGAPKLLLVTSTRAAEGKSSTTLALAQNFARMGKSVLLIDGDLRKPAFVTGSQERGMSKLLTNSEALRDHASPTKFENLWLVPCGPIPPNPAELLASARVKALLREATEQFDMVIVDGPPVLGLADAPLLSADCQATLMVIESGKTRTKAAQDAINRLRASDGNVIGAVLTKFRHQAHGYGYGYDPYKYGGVGSREREIRLLTDHEAT